MTFSDQVQRAFERAEDDIDRRWAVGELTNAERNQELRDLQRDYADAAEEAAQEAYEAERRRW